MTDPTNNSEEIIKKLSRRNMLRDSVITATGVAILPSFLSSCTKDAWQYIHGHGGKGVGEDPPPLSNFELRTAARNLLYMKDWVTDLYILTGKYEEIVFKLLKSGEKPKEWNDFILNIFTEIANGILEAAAVVAEVELPGAGAAIAIAVENIKQWTSDDKPNNLEAEFAEFENAHLQMQIAIENMLSTLADATDDYKNLREGWPGEIELNGKKYTLRDLAGSQFPNIDASFPETNKGEAYAKLKTAAYDRFRKYIWNVMFIKAGEMTYSAAWTIGPADLGPWGADATPTYYGRETHYKDYPATYLRGYRQAFFENWVFRYWYWTFDGLELSATAAKELFKDDTPEHIINPDGLFLRSYVFKQFHTKKPDFFGYHELRKDTESVGDDTGNGYAFDVPDNYEFTGGDFLMLTIH